jgi:adenosine kinase
VTSTSGSAGATGISWVSPSAKIRDPPADPLVEVTGGGDAYRAGLLKGYLLGQPWPVAGRMASISAVYAVERQGPQEHEYTPEEFVARFDSTFPEYAGTITAEQLSRPAIAGPAD